MSEKVPAFRHLRFKEADRHQRIQHQLSALLFREDQIATFLFEREKERRIVNTKA
ncbi:hypothetical protein D3C77_779460 [compost metagenome]